MPELYTTHYINIDSRNRQINDIIEYGDSYVVRSNSISIDPPYMNIYGPSLRIGQQLKIFGFTPIKKIIRSSVLGVSTIVIYEDTNIVKIKYPHNFHDTTNTNDCTVTILNFKCDCKKVSDLINKEHILFSSIPGYDYNVEHFYIKLDNTINKYDVPLINEHNFTLLFNYVSDIPLKTFNDVIKVCAVDKCLSKINIGATIQVKNIHCDLNVKTINKIIHGFSDAGRYKINLQNTYKNIVSANLQNYNFPDLKDKITITHNNTNISWSALGNKVCVYIKEGIYDIIDYIYKVNKKVRQQNIEFSVSILCYGNIKLSSNIFINSLEWKALNISGGSGNKFYGKYVITDYLMLKIDNISVIRNNNKEYFAKIDLSDKDIPIQPRKFIASPIDSISELDISIYDYNDNLFKLYNYEHSFILELITINDSVSLANYYSKTLSNYNNNIFNLPT